MKLKVNDKFYYYITHFFVLVFTLVPIVFHASIVFAMLSFLLLAKKWPKIMKRWESIENDLPLIQNEKKRKLLCRKVHFIAFTVSILSLSEYL